ncbi:type II toxin-antitoxin system VapC family toxin [Halococcoides cellulosivorans]|uniref:PIN domain-containing protein n=1 Tax=Halococcoides cellulosivorans TaxID=1679096 RepID=A0A2R4X4F4_9EURY|nr:hypothetical protein [Halococcoides cellulosivorans]AWB28677.1 hypothetical protein HARCEL1_08220 [Halococcoides cellulosivorans]
MPDGPYLFDVGVTTLAHAGTPVSDVALSWVRRAIEGEIDAVVPTASLVGAHHVLTSVNGFTNEDASTLLSRLLDAQRIHWHESTSVSSVRAGFDRASAATVEGWNALYAQIAAEEGVETVLTLDDDFERFEEFDVEVILSREEFRTVEEYLGY